MSHTKEPWEIREGWSASVFYKEQCIAGCCEPQSEDNARRIVACVNACAGIPTYQLTAEDDKPTDLGEMIDVLRRQRDELLAVLVNSRNALESANEMGDGPIVDTIWYSPHETLFDYMDAALAGSQGGAA